MIIQTVTLQMSSHTYTLITDLLINAEEVIFLHFQRVGILKNTPTFSLSTKIFTANSAKLFWWPMLSVSHTFFSGMAHSHTVALLRSALNSCILQSVLARLLSVSSNGVMCCCSLTARLRGSLFISTPLCLANDIQ